MSPVVEIISAFLFVARWAVSDAARIGCLQLRRTMSGWLLGSPQTVILSSLERHFLKRNRLISVGCPSKKRPKKNALTGAFGFSSCLAAVMAVVPICKGTDTYRREG